MDNNGDTRATVLIFYGNRVDDIRMQGDVINTLAARMGTGGNNMPLVAYPIQDGREMDKKQNGLGIGEEGDPSYTLDRTGGQSVAYPIQGTIIGRSDTAGPQGKGFGDVNDPMYTIDTVGGNAVAHVGNFELYDFPKEEVSPTLNAKRAKDTLSYEESSVVRRLTPRECERLQGFPDDWTASQSDSQRYKQMGNAVAVPVVEWIVSRLVEVDARLNAESKE
jgi:DNA (cytosine-5)-methyltransferase 1